MSIFCCVTTLQSQNDTIWYDARWKESDKSEASFYRISTKEQSGLFKIRDYYLSGKLQMEGFSTKADKDFFVGKVVWFREDGKVFQTGNFVKGKLEGEFVSYLEDKKFMGTYQNGRLFSGKQNLEYRGYHVYSEIKKDSLLEIAHLGSLKGKRNVRYTHIDENGKWTTVSTVSYDNANKVFAEAIYVDGALYSGAERSFYNLDNSSQTITHYEKGKYLNTSYYDESGMLRVHFMRKPNYQTVFYDEKGTKLDSIQYRWKNGYLSPYQGKNYIGKKGYFSSKEMEFGGIQAYENGFPIWEKKFNNGVLTSYTQYGDQNKKEKILYYDATGNVNDSLIYKSYVPWNGIEYANDYVRRYSKGKLTQEKQYYQDTQKVFKNRDGAIEIYYDLEGSEIGRLTLSKENYYTPLNGKQFFKDSKGRLINIYEYKDEAKTKETNFTYDYDTGLAYKEETFYDPSGYNYIKKVQYHSNGNKRSEISYKRYKEIEGVFYDTDGQQVSTYDYVNKNGTLFEYFYGMDAMSKMEKRNNGELERLLRYEQVYLQGRSKTEVLVEDIDVNSIARIYTREGELLSSLKYKNKMPYEGTFYDYKTRERFTFSEAKLNGKYEKLRYDQIPEVVGAYLNNKKEGQFNYYDSYGKVTHFINYSKDKREGEATYYDKLGKVISTMIFKNDFPYDGTEILSTYQGKTEKVYIQGTLKSELKYLSTGNVLREYNQNADDLVTVYHPGSEVIKYNFALNRGSLNGPVVRNDAKGNEIHRAVFASGKLESGTVWMLPLYDYDKELEKVICTKTSDNIEIQYQSKEGEIVFKVFEKTRPQASRRYLDRLDIRTDNVNYLDLY
ncbi:MAG: hypothetical protein AAGA43_03025 [Bacteroidota bacterium]